MDKQEWEDFFKQECFSKRHCWELDGYRAIVSTMVANEMLFEGVRVLDIGCAFGDGIDYLSKQSQFKDCEFEGIDWSDEAIRWAIEKNKNSKVSFTAEDWKASKKKGDVVIVSRVLDYMPQEEWTPFLKSVRKLAPLTFVVVNKDSFKNRKKFRGASYFETDKYLVCMYERITKS